MARAAKTAASDGRVWVFLSWASLFLILALSGGLGLLICINGFGALWPGRMEFVRLKDGSSFLGVRTNGDAAPDGTARTQYKVGNRELNAGADFRWVREYDIARRDRPADATLVKRLENGDFFGFFATTAYGVGETPAEFEARLDDYRRRWDAEAEPLRRRIAKLGEEWRQANLSVQKARYEMNRAASPAHRNRWAAALQKERDREDAAKAESEILLAEFGEIRERFSRETAVFVTAEGDSLTLLLSSVVSVSLPNAMTPAERLATFFVNAWDLLTQDPREANTEGGIYPALFGTIMLVFLMAVSAFPLGVAAGVYLREYAKDGFMARTARVAVNNLAGVPSIVYGIFGLGFFVYGVGGTIDQLLYPERVAAGISVYGGGGIIWSSLTLGLLTLPVVIVATEEALAAVPSEVRHASLALGATRFQTLWRVILPMAGPGILTGFILAMARAAGEVAPLMLTGAVKSAHSLPVDGAWPFLHLERKFMHLGFHIYDMGFQSPNVEASKPLVYLTSLVLLALVFILNFAAISLRRRMREKFAMKGF